MKDFVNKALEQLNEDDRKYPNRHKEIHKGCCKNCPSNRNKLAGVTDPESADIKTLPKEVIAKEYLFVCAWRPNKLCKGLCDYMEIDEEFIRQVNREHCSCEIPEKQTKVSENGIHTYCIKCSKEIN